MNVKILNKILASQIKKILKGLYTMIKWNSRDARMIQHPQLASVIHIDKIKDKNHIISIDAEKAFDKIRHQFTIKLLKSLWQNSTSIDGKTSQSRRNIPQHNKGLIWQNPQLTLYSVVKAESFSYKIQNKSRIPTLTFFF